MVDISDKKPTRHQAVVVGEIMMQPTTLQAIMKERIRKGNVLTTARLTGIIAAKNTSSLIPLCHPINITNVKMDLKPCQPKIVKNLNALPSARIEIKTTVEAFDRTGVEMEALVATTVACLTIYDMCKGIDRGMTIGGIKLIEKSGGRSGHYRRKES